MGLLHADHAGLRGHQLERVSHHARHGAMAQRFSTIMHTSTHLNAPIHLVQRAVTVGNLPLDRFFGTGVVVSIPKQKWELIGPRRIWRPRSRRSSDGDIVLIVTGWHRHYSDSIRYFGHAPGLAEGRRRVAGGAQRQAGRHRHRHDRSSARDLARAASQRAADPLPAAGIQEGDRTQRDRRFPRVESGAQDAARGRHSDHRERRRRCRRGGRQALHVPRLSVEMDRGRRLRDPAGRHGRSARAVTGSKPAQARSATRIRFDKGISSDAGLRYGRAAVLRPHPALGHGIPQWPGGAAASRGLAVNTVQFHARTACWCSASKASCIAAPTWTRRST